MLALLTVHHFGRLLHNLLALSQDELDVAWVGPGICHQYTHIIDFKSSVNSHVRIDTTMSTIRASPLFRCLVDLNVLDDEVVGVETLGIGIGFRILEQRLQELCRLHRPASLRDTELLAYTPTNLISILFL
jgi:hypothetical protein